MHISLTSAYWKMYTIVIQLGAILALLLLFFPRIVDLFRSFPSGDDNNHTFWDHPVTLTAIAFIVTSIPSLLLIKAIGKDLESLTIMAWSLVIGGVIMWVVDAWSDRREHAYETQEIERMSMGQAIWVGLCQITSAVFPGTSRSMSTITGGQMAGMSRPAALEFSFLLSIPIMIAATGYETLRTLHPKHVAGADALSPLVMTTHGWIVLAIGLIVSFIVAFGVVEWFLRWVRHHGFVPFAVYRILAGAALFAWIHHWI
ncbi:MAG TPA: undecaprenyl-diphosphate phosphatase, partial [Acidobacteriaceae bacterium]|nr:undecaprenyl-diphosphate phosphatase [Acidobacteriaceae bacterium]